MVGIHRFPNDELRRGRHGIVSLIPGRSIAHVFEPVRILRDRSRAERYSRPACYAGGLSGGDRPFLFDRDTRSLVAASYPVVRGSSRIIGREADVRHPKREDR